MRTINILQTQALLSLIGMIEVTDEKNGFIFGNYSYQNIIDYKVLSADIVENKLVQSISIINDTNNNTNNNTYDTDIAYTCVHGNKISYKSINYLPSQYWHELISCWSCHNDEFGCVKQFQLKVRKEGILVSSFFLMINSSDIPKCCNEHNAVTMSNTGPRDVDIHDGGVSKIWFNELSGVNHTSVVYRYLQHFFKSCDALILDCDNIVYELKHFYNCKYLISDGVKYENCMKIGVRVLHEHNTVPDNEYINPFYKQYILECIIYTGVAVMNYRTGYICC